MHEAIEGTYSEAGSAQLTVALLRKFNLACFQNAVPIIRELKIINALDQPIRELELKMSSAPAFFRERVWRIEQIAPKSELHVTDLDLELDPLFLAQLEEAERAVVTFVLRAGPTELARASQEVLLLAPAEWGGISSLPEILAAFIRPNDPAVETILRSAAELLAQDGRQAAIEGYLSNSRERVWEIASAIWSAICSLGLTYVVPPASFEQEGQKIRSPSHIVIKRLATCLDTSLLFASCLEQAGLNPLIVLRRGHALAGCWLENEDFSTAVIDDAQSLRKRIQLQEMILFETTLTTSRPPAKFSEACQSGAEQVRETHDSEFELAIDIRRARMKRIRPLSDRAETPDEASATTVTPEVVAGIEQSPALRMVSPHRSADAEETPTGRLERWKRKLLDLSLRNRLLNFRATRLALHLEVPDSATLEDRLASGIEMKILPQPPLMDLDDPRSAQLDKARTHEDIIREYAREALERREVLVNLPADQLDARLTDLYRSARAAIEEGGANTLFLAIGFLSWKKDERSKASYKAPLVLVPVSLV